MPISSQWFRTQRFRKKCPSCPLVAKSKDLLLCFNSFRKSYIFLPGLVMKLRTKPFRIFRWVEKTFLSIKDHVYLPIHTSQLCKPLALGR